jgi:hypothetical protein
MMEEKYHGIVFGGCLGIMYENWYDNKQKAESEVRRKAKELVRNSNDEHMDAQYTVSLDDKIIAAGDVPLRGLRNIGKNHPGNEWHDYGFMMVNGERIEQRLTAKEIVWLNTRTTMSIPGMVIKTGRTISKTLPMTRVLN